MEAPMAEIPTRVFDAPPEAPMTDAPERIRVWPDYNDHANPVTNDWSGGYWDATQDPLGIEYRRADLPPTDAQLAADPRVRALVDALERAQRYIAGPPGIDRTRPLLRQIAAALAAFQQGDTDAQLAQKALVQLHPRRRAYRPGQTRQDQLALR
jgi:hypothetical protein